MEFRKAERNDRRLDSKETASLLYKVVKDLEKAGFECWMDNNRLRNFRVNPLKRPHNINTSSGRRGTYLNWYNWVEVNNIVNNRFDKEGITAKVISLGGKFVIRHKDGGYSEGDWESQKYENCGSVMNPITREEIWVEECLKDCRTCPSGLKVLTSLENCINKAKDRNRERRRREKNKKEITERRLRCI